MPETAYGPPASKNNLSRERGISVMNFVSLDVDHDLPGVTSQMLDWWWDHMDGENYKLWHPTAHVSMDWEVPPPAGSRYGGIHLAREYIGQELASLRIRRVPEDQAPIQLKYKNAIVSTGLAPDNSVMMWIIHSYEDTPRGAQLHTTFLLPQGIPQAFVDALRQHNIEEMAQIPKFLPDLYRRSTGAAT